MGEKIIDVFAREFRAHPAEEYVSFINFFPSPYWFLIKNFQQERCIKAGTLTVNYEKVDTDYRLKHNDLLANIVHR